ncbi:hypothetical protein MRB53_035368 [Persea americana]|uniref:Uncharacterized protein n=1 Tax=Persea americana TaxID=3435 RepID=A0ACC2K4M4_PERAE|nr:hypothetical protein MRB53_035368 [Persea americana]
MMIRLIEELMVTLNRTIDGRGHQEERLIQTLLKSITIAARVSSTASSTLASVYIIPRSRIQLQFVLLSRFDFFNLLPRFNF